jgi:quinol monooxygenase YgiN
MPFDIEIVRRSDGFIDYDFMEWESPAHANRWLVEHNWADEWFARWKDRSTEEQRKALQSAIDGLLAE